MITSHQDGINDQVEYAKCVNACQDHRKHPQESVFGAICNMIKRNWIQTGGVFSVREDPLEYL